MQIYQGIKLALECKGIIRPNIALASACTVMLNCRGIKLMANLVSTMNEDFEICLRYLLAKQESCTELRAA